MKKTNFETIENIEVEVVEFDEEKALLNMEENDWSKKLKDLKGGE